MLHKTTVRLTLGYLAVVMTISVIFSLVLYNVSAREISNGLRRQLPYFQVYGPAQSDTLDLRDMEAIEEGQSKDRLQLRLVLANLIVLIGGGGVCFWLARRTLEPIEQAFESQSRFTADASHELRTPLTAMKAEIEVALRDKRLTAAEARELLASNLEEVAKLESLANGLLRLARHERAPLASLEPVSLALVASEAVKRVTARAEQRAVSLSNQAEGILVSGDREHLVELVAMLLDNAIKYGPEDGVVTLTTQTQKTSALLQVRDTGAGIDPVDLPRIFDRFYRADTSRSRSGAGGYGLGLSIAREIAVSYGGRLAAANATDGGAVFTLTLPLAS